MNTQSILEQATFLYGVKPIRQNTMGNSGTNVFEVETPQQAYILKVSECTPELKQHTAFELSWMEFLASHMRGIVRPRKSFAGNLYEVVSVDDDAYILSLLEKAPGKLVDITDPHQFNEDLFFNLGALLGTMHRLTVGYEGNVRRPEFEWTGPVNAWRHTKPLPDEEVRICLERYRDEICALPVDKETYGIIHWDAHTDNFFVDEGDIYLFDFDACQFNWYAADMASAVFFMVQKGAGPLTGKSDQERTTFAETYLLAYLKGYLQTNATSAYWVRKIDLFMRYQMYDEYLFARDYWPGELAHRRDWYLNWHKERITKGLPYVFVDYDKILEQLPEIRS